MSEKEFCSKCRHTLGARCSLCGHEFGCGSIAEPCDLCSELIIPEFDGFQSAMIRSGNTWEGAIVENPHS